MRRRVSAREHVWGGVGGNGNDGIGNGIGNGIDGNGNGGNNVVSGCKPPPFVRSHGLGRLSHAVGTNGNAVVPV